MLKRAKKIDLFDGNGNLWGMKGIVNEENILEQFNTVSDGYTIIQHEELVDTVNKALSDLNLTANQRLLELNEGGRLHIDLQFPNIKHDVENNGMQICLRATYDNSYNGTTGLRLQVGASSQGGGFLWVKGLEENYYHRHTKGIDLGDFEKKLDKGINSFQTKIKDHFFAMVNTPCTRAQAENWLDGLIKSDKNVTKGYLESIRAKLPATISNKWQVYVTTCDIISKEASSIDVRNRQLALVVGDLHRCFKDSTAKSVKEAVQDLPIFSLMTLSEVTIPLPEIKEEVTIVKINRKKFRVMEGDKIVRSFKRYELAKEFLKAA